MANGILQTAPKEAAPEKEKVSTQASYDKLAENALKIMNEPNVADSIAQRLINNPDPVAEIGAIALDIMKRLEQSAEGKFPLTAGAIVNGLNMIVGNIIEIAKAVGAEEFSDEDKYQAYIWALSNYIDQAVENGALSKEDLVALSQMVGNQPSNSKGPGGK